LPFRETTIQVNKNKACKLARIKQIRIHDFRHSCASLLINKGASIALVSKYLGHSNISITLNTYTHMYKSELDNMIKILNNL
jgi:integrase